MVHDSIKCIFPFINSTKFLNTFYEPRTLLSFGDEVRNKISKFPDPKSYNLKEKTDNRLEIITDCDNTMT
jgi:hypothetical protein